MGARAFLHATAYAAVLLVGRHAGGGEPVVYWGACPVDGEVVEEDEVDALVMHPPTSLPYALLRCPKCGALFAGDPEEEPTDETEIGEPGEECGP